MIQIKPKDLTDQHLIVEYLESIMVPAALKRTMNSHSGLRLIEVCK